MIDWMYPLVLLSPADRRAAARASRRGGPLVARWLNHSARDKTLTFQVPEGPMTLAYDRAFVHGVPVEEMWAREHVGLALSTFGRAVRIRCWLDANADLVIDLTRYAPSPL